jgi:hypothetical protein
MSAQTSPPFSPPEFPATDEATWRRAAEEGEHLLEKTVDGLRFSAINTATDSSTSVERDQGALPWSFGTLEVALPCPLPTGWPRTTLASKDVGYKINPRDLPTFTDQLDPDTPPPRLSIEPTDASDNLSAYLTYLREQPNPENVSGAAYLPSTRLDHWQDNPIDLTLLGDLTREASDLLSLSTITVRGDHFEQWGPWATDELALTLSWWVAYCDQLTDLGLPIETIVGRTELSLCTSADYFINLAKLRALRSLVGKVSKAYGLNIGRLTGPRVRAVSGWRNKTFYDADGNLLRNTTEALSSLLGGVNTLSLLPHDFLSTAPDPFGIRMVRNTYQILKHEAHLPRVADPAAGSYFIENLTGQLVEQSWRQFLSWEEQGGFVNLLEEGTLEAHCRSHAAEQAEAVRTHRRPLVGATRYGNAQEQSSAPPDLSLNRWALPFEAIRNTIDREVAHGRVRPAVGLCVQSGEALANHRRNYVRDVLTCLGLSAQDVALTELYALPSALVAIAFCGTDTYYQATVADTLRNRPNAALPHWIAGGSSETIKQLRDAGGDGVLGIGHDPIILIEPLINQWIHEA